MKTIYVVQRVLMILAILVLVTLPLAAQNQVRILQSNAASDRAHIIDPATNKVVGEILGIEAAHGISASPDGSRIYISSEGDETLDVIDATTLKVIKKIPLSGHPNNIAIAPGRIPMINGSAESHGLAVTPDQKILMVCSRLNNALYSYSLPDLKLLGTANLSGKGAAWITLTPDGKRAYVADPVTNNTLVVDIPTMKEVAKIPVGQVPKRNHTMVIPATRASIN